MQIQLLNENIISVSVPNLHPVIFPVGSKEHGKRNSLDLGFQSYFYEVCSQVWIRIKTSPKFGIGVYGYVYGSVKLYDFASAHCSIGG